MNDRQTTRTDRGLEFFILTHPNLQGPRDGFWHPQYPGKVDARIHLGDRVRLLNGDFATFNGDKGIAPPLWLFGALPGDFPFWSKVTLSDGIEYYTPREQIRLAE